MFVRPRFGRPRKPLPAGIQARLAQAALRAAHTAGALVLAPALGLYGRAIAHQGREPELEELPATTA